MRESQVFFKYWDSPYNRELKWLNKDYLMNYNTVIR